jgi:hypothetical protein
LINPALLHLKRGVKDMYMLEAIEIEILNYLYELGTLGMFWGWERQSNLDENAVDRLYRAELVDKSNPPGFIRLSERGVGTVLFGFKKADKIIELL